jgi:hypothetical protein
LKRDHSKAELVKQFAARTGRKLRAAQVHCQRESEDWRAFLAALDGGGPGPGGPGEPAAAKLAIPAARVFVEEMRRGAGAFGGAGGAETPAAEDERRAELLWRANMAAAEAAAVSGDATAAVMFCRVAGEAQKQVAAARRARLQDDLDRRILIPAGEFEAFRAVLLQVASMVKGLDRELASRVNPAEPHFARAAIAVWLRDRWNPAIEELIRKAEVGPATDCAA